MPITIKTKEEIAILREGGRRHARILRDIAKLVKAGVSSKELDDKARFLTLSGGDRPAFLGYTPHGAKRPFPGSLCISINSEVVHGIPNEPEKILNEGDIVSIDMGLIHDGLITDMAVTVPVGKIDRIAGKLLSVTEEALLRGIKACRGGGTTGDIGYAIGSFVKSKKFGIVRELAGHGVGYSLHEDPYVPNYGEKGRGAKLLPGMVIAIEPIINEGGGEIALRNDGYTYETADGKRSAHFEHTVVVTEKGCKILTSL